MYLLTLYIFHSILLWNADYIPIEIVDRDFAVFHIYPMVEQPQMALSASDTVQLPEVEVFTAPLDKYAFGHRIQVIGEKDLESFQGLPLAEYLQQRTGLFLRQYGPGMVASLTMRGTSAGHNVVFWNGLPINSPSLGQTDFSILPVGGFDQVLVHFGSGGALYGTDAIGGAVHLNNKPHFGGGHQVQVASLFGSFGRWNQQVQYSYSNKVISSRSRIYRNFSRNDFPFRNLSKIGTPIERQENGQVKQWGIMQDLAWNVNSKNQISSAIWWNKTDRHIQPVIGSNTKDVQQDQNLRWVLDYFHFGKNKIWNAKAGFVRDELIFNVNSINNTNQYFIAGDLDWEVNPRWNTKSGIRHTYITGDLDTYQASESRLELYQSNNFHPIEKLSFSVNLRQLVFMGNWAPFTPSFGGEWNVWKNKVQSFLLKTSFARSFKVPTLNDRFWVPGGNPDLESEKSWSGEIGLKHVFVKNNFNFEQQITHFRMSVDNWIIWLPNGSYWSPKNIRKVNNSGLEYFLDVTQQFGEWKLGLSGNYAWNRAINQTNISENDRSKGKQLPYTPEHKFQSMISIEKGDFSSFLNTQRVGERFAATDNVAKLNPYQLWDMGVDYRWTLGGRLSGNLGAQVNNLFNTDYQVLRLRAMPGRNYQFNLNITI
ncbi:iron complex outermembrane recepter protein [Aquiflexum balticum DSM 16537]|uniref:Iron complex outermembrane recepter protein n=1 Tax=Aquiflexum balticum DSM 16537 TaxID=758820 RepID=A0A1W2H480_9BACT|nr:TonB-dependent receptor [Aquiflexum balticum]SMD43276.1 iron complex outermembrane recepter protein [Aquiflexum balticum DSM 16537]